MPMDIDLAGGYHGAVTVEETNSGGSDIFGVLGTILDGAKDVVSDVYSVIGVREARAYELERLKLANQQALGSQQTAYATDGSGQINFPLWSLLLAAIGVGLTAYAIFRK